jgi:transposase
MVVADGKGVPVGVSVHSASPHEITLARETLAKVTEGKPERLISDRAYDSDAWREYLAERGTELIVPHRKGRRKKATQDGRKLRRYKRRWIVERTNAWLGNFRRLVVRWDRDVTIYRAFVHIACLLIACRYL